MPKLPVIYLSHGSPFSAFTEDKTSDFWRRLGNAILRLEGVKQILVISAHWEERPLKINSTSKPETIYDFYGFPSHFYKYKYPGKGSPELSRKITESFPKSSKFEIELDPHHGLDHGTWVPLKWMLPNGELPVVQMSLLHGSSMQDHVQIGKSLAYLREEGVLIIASGTSVHNLRDYMGSMGKEGWVANYVAPFDNHLDEIILGATTESERTRKLIDLEKHPLLRKAHPSLEHLLPLHVAGGAAGSDPARKIYENYFVSFSESAYAFGNGLSL